MQALKYSLGKAFWTSWIVAGLLALATFRIAHAQESSTIKKIRETGILTLGYREASIPFSFLDSRQRPVGYTIDICRRIGESIKAQFKLPELEYKMVAVTPATRLALVSNGTIDMECGSTTNTPERQRSVSFLVTTFVAATRFLSRKEAPVTSVKDLRGKSVVSSSGTTSMYLLSTLNQRNDLNMQVMSAIDHAEAFSMVESGRAAAFLMDDVLLYGLLAGVANPSGYVLSDETFSVEPYAILVRKEDTAFQRIANQAIVDLFRNGEIYSIYKRWFESPIPPNESNLNMPMSLAVRRVIAKPSDSGVVQDYK